MKKFLLAGLILVSIGAYGAAGQVDENIDVYAEVLENLEIVDNTGDLTAGGALYFGQMFVGDDKDTWTGGNGAHPAQPTIIAKGTATVTKTSALGTSTVVHGIDMNGSIITYTIPATTIITNIAGDTITVDLYDESDGNGGNVTLGTAPTTAGATNQLATLLDDAVVADQGYYQLTIHGKITNAQNTGNYTGYFPLTAKYDASNTWY